MDRRETRCQMLKGRRWTSLDADGGRNGPAGDAACHQRDVEHVSDKRRVTQRFVRAGAALRLRQIRHQLDPCLCTCERRSKVSYSGNGTPLRRRSSASNSWATPRAVGSPCRARCRHWAAREASSASGSFSLSVICQFCRRTLARGLNGCPSNLQFLKHSVSGRCRWWARRCTGRARGLCGLSASFKPHFDDALASFDNVAQVNLPTP